jgi:hypothetical protein
MIFSNTDTFIAFLRDGRQILQYNIKKQPENVSPAAACFIYF